MQENQAQKQQYIQMTKQDVLQTANLYQSSFFGLILHAHPWSFVSSKTFDSYRKLEQNPPGLSLLREMLAKKLYSASLDNVSANRKPNGNMYVRIVGA